MDPLLLLLTSIHCKVSTASFLASIDINTNHSTFLYTQLPAASVYDSCRPVGASYTNIIVVVYPGGLSTVSYDIPIGATFQPNQYDGKQKFLI